MIRFIARFILMVPFCWLTGFAQGPAPHQLLPEDTIGYVTIPNYQNLIAKIKQTGYYRLWRDPAMEPFKTKFMNQLRARVIQPLEQKAGIKWADYAELLQGQVTLALLRDGWEGKRNQTPAWVLIIDAQEKQDQIAPKLTALRTQLYESNQPVRLEFVRDKEFTVYMPARNQPGLGERLNILIGQSESLLLAGNSTKALRRILIRQSDPDSSGIEDQAAFQVDYQTRLRENLYYGWLNFGPLREAGLKLMRESSSVNNAVQQNPLIPAPEKIVEALGLNGLKTLTFSGNETPQGTTAAMYLGVPESQRKGLFSMMGTEAEDAAPPAFVPEKIINYSRYRMNLPKLWSQFESMVNELSPQMSALLQMSLMAIGKDKDPNFDFKSTFLSNLGDDIITVQAAPTGTSFEEMSSPPTLYLIGSPNPDQVISALKLASSFMPASTSEGGLREREFLGRKIFELPLPTGAAVPPVGGKAPAQLISFSHAKGYVAIASETGLLENFLRDDAPAQSTLRQKSGLNSAALAVGGMNRGLFGFQNDQLMFRNLFQVMKANEQTLEGMLAMVPMGGGKSGAEVMKDWVDFSLLPNFDRVAQYFNFTVYGGATDPSGLQIRLFTPAPEGAR